MEMPRSETGLIYIWRGTEVTSRNAVFYIWKKEKTTFLNFMIYLDKLVGSKKMRVWRVNLIRVKSFHIIKGYGRLPDRGEELGIFVPNNVKADEVIEGLQGAGISIFGDNPKFKKDKISDYFLKILLD